jgi:hypothetical protein
LAVFKRKHILNRKKEREKRIVVWPEQSLKLRSFIDRYTEYKILVIYFMNLTSTSCSFLTKKTLWQNKLKFAMQKCHTCTVKVYTLFVVCIHILRGKDNYSFFSAGNYFFAFQMVLKTAIQVIFF